ncbi:MAG: glycosyltransferase family 2 protein [Ignavibacteria bacterium]|nr:glycosyltransferase family 2 protein [Ignavibacteria bacterium]
MTGSKNKLVSVIIPYYNRIGLLKESINSVIKQTYKPIELILVDDFSAEKFEIESLNIKNTKEFSVKIVRNENNIGPGLSRETGRLVAKGDYLAYLDSDDFWNEGFLEKLISYLDNNEEVGMAYCKTMLIRTAGNF